MAYLKHALRGQISLKNYRVGQKKYQDENSSLLEITFHKICGYKPCKCLMKSCNLTSWLTYIQKWQELEHKYNFRKNRTYTYYSFHFTNDTTQCHLHWKWLMLKLMNATSLDQAETGNWNLCCWFLLKKTSCRRY